MRSGANEMASTRVLTYRFVETISTPGLLATTFTGSGVDTCVHAPFGAVAQPTASSSSSASQRATSQPRRRRHYDPAHKRPQHRGPRDAAGQRRREAFVESDQARADWAVAQAQVAPRP